MANLVILLDRIDERLAALGMSDRKASLAANAGVDLIRNIRRGKEPSRDRIEALASALNTHADYLLGRSDAPSPPDSAADDDPRPVPRPADMPRDIPVYGTAIGSEMSLHADGAGMVAVEQTDLNTGEVIDYFRRPPLLRDRRDIYALYVAGTSMEPAYEPGQGILVDPRRTANVRDYVVVYLRGLDDGTSAVLVKRLVRRSASFIELEQYNPPLRFQLDSKRVRAVHRVMPWDEVFGL